MGVMFTWIDYYQELANKILSYKSNRSAFIKIVEQAYANAGLEYKFKWNGHFFTDMDPFTFFGSFNKGITDKHRIELLQQYKALFSIESDTPVDFKGVPVLSNLKAWFMADEPVDEMETYWALFEAAIRYADGEDGYKAKVGSLFDKAVSYKGTGWNLTMALYWIRPYAFINLDQNSRDLLVAQKHYDGHFPTGEEYIALCHDLAGAIDSGEYSYKSFPELSYQAWKDKKQAGAPQDTKKGSSNRAWLISWNRKYWPWENYTEVCYETRNGKPFYDSWASASKNPQIGEEVFLIKLGDQPRGIVGHGTVVKELHEKDHYLSSKAEAGEKIQAIGVSFDRLLDYEKEKYIPQNELIEKCTAQHWSPQSSGVEIKTEVLPVLRALWDTTIETNANDEWWPTLSEYDPGITAQAYHDLFLDESVVKRSWLEALYEMYGMPEHLGTCKQMGKAYGYAPSHYISYLTTAAANIANTTECPLLPREEENARYWPVLFQGKQPSDRSLGNYCWRMREPVVQAIEMLIEEGLFSEKEKDVMTQFDHNMILYGPPGTGKTYNSVIYAVAICENRTVEDVMKEPYSEVLLRYKDLQDAGQIAFTTFHQSYGYEEFIEGIKPKLNDESGTLAYIIEDGIFKSFCRCATAVNIQTKTSVKIKDHPRIWVMILGGSGMTPLKEECFYQNEVRIGWSEVDDEQWRDDENLSWRAKQMLHAFIYEMEPGDIVFIEKNSQSVDAIGVIAGEYEYDKNLGEYPRTRKVEWLAKDIDLDLVQYLPREKKQLARFTVYSIDYMGYEALSEIMKEYIGDQAVSTEKNKKPYVFIIDEINRGNISKVFGELITLIEGTKREGASEEMEATLPYSGEAFSVPENVYILGTMNTADRSIALMDTALRRRFEFIEMMPDSEVLESLGVGTIKVNGVELNVAKMLNVINERIEYLFDREHTIGHAFFTKLAENPSLSTLADIFEKNVIPLLQEYFYEDYEKIQLVLGDNAKEDEFKFILDKPLKIKDLFKGNPDIDLPEKGYVIQQEAFLKLESYKQIGEGL